jgi:hypothetical protein
VKRIWWLALLLACAPARQEAEVDPGAGGPPELGSTLNVRVEGDSARLELHVTNVMPSVVVLEFATSQRYDFDVSDGAGEVVWRWSDDMMFAQVVGQEALQPGGSLRYTATWAAGAAAGVYVARGVLTSRNYPVELRTSFRMPAE